MENASKALLMAGAVLIGVMLISFAVVIFQMFGKFSKEQQEQISDKTIQQFNIQFLIYEGEGKNAHDVVSVVHLVQDVRAGKTSLTQGYNDKLKVIVKGRDFTEKKEAELIEFLKDNTATYKCKVIYNENGRVSKVIFE